MTGQVLVTGFDDIPAARLVRPSLTTIRHAPEDLAALARDLALAQQSAGLGERRPPFHTGRIFWKNLPEGAVRVGCEAEQDLAVNAVRLERQLNVFLLNPRAEAVSAEVVVAQTALAPQARLVTATEATPYQEQEVYGQGADRFLVSLPPRSVSALLCRLSGSSARFKETRWPAPRPEVLFLSDLPWLSSITAEGGAKPFSDGLQVNWRRDETSTGEWIVQREIRYRRGLTHLGKGEITFAIPAGAARFEALVGVDDGSTGEGPATFQIKVDGRVAAESRPLKKGEAPEALTASLGGACALTLAVDTADARANVAWLETKFVFEGGALTGGRGARSGKRMAEMERRKCEGVRRWNAGNRPKKQDGRAQVLHDRCVGY